jgi:hypothetical protein
MNYIKIGNITSLNTSCFYNNSKYQDTTKLTKLKYLDLTQCTQVPTLTNSGTQDILWYFDKCTDLKILVKNDLYNDFINNAMWKDLSVYIKC